MLGLGLGLTFSRVGGESTSSFFDQFGTPAAAYSLRDLSGSNPNVIEVRRSSDNAVQDFTASEITDGSLATWVGAGNDGFVRTWYDQAGANDATQTTAANQPLIVSAGSVVLENGLPAVQFSGTNKNFEIQTTIPVSDDLFLLMVYTSDTSIGQYIVNRNLSSGYGIFLESRAYLLRNNLGVVVLNTGLPNKWAVAGQDLILGYTQGSDIFSKAQGQTASAPYIPSNFDFKYIGNTFSAGGGRYINGRLQELIIYEADKSSDRTEIETNINDHYSIY